MWFAITENWFKPPMEVIDQGGTLSPTLFAVFVNDLVEEINSLSCGVTVGRTTANLFAPSTVRVGGIKTGTFAAHKNLNTYSA